MKPLIALALASLCGLSACSKKSAPPAEVDASPVVIAPVPSSSGLPHVTAASIAVSNLNDDIAYRGKHADDPVIGPTLVDALLTRAQFLGTIADLDAAAARVDADLAARPNDPKAHMAKAAVAGSFHDFAGALKELDRATALGAPSDGVWRARQPVALALGRCERAEAMTPQTDDVLPLDLVTRAALEQRRGRPQESERLFTLARDRYRDVSPFAVAWMDFERARALDRQGELAAAKQFYAEAVALLPMYAHAVIHLASSEPPARALELLGQLDPSCDDPDALSAKADALRRAGRADEAAAATDKARARFEELLAKHPLAFADHGAAFFLGLGKDVPRALALAKQAAANAPSEDALSSWLTAATSLGSHDEICAALKAANAQECKLGPVVQARFDAIKASCGG